MKIKQIGPYTGDIISTMINNRNIENIDLFLNPNDDNNLDPFKLKNMREGTEILLAHLIAETEIGLLVDPDADGFSSSSIIYQYMKKINPNCKIKYFLHDGKSHGLTAKIREDISKTEIDLIVIPDAGSNDIDSVNLLHAMGIDILIIDHHEVEDIAMFGTLINNQLDDNEETNRNLVGAGMALKFCEALDKTLNLDFSKDLYDLVAIGQIGDASDISQNEVRNLVFKGLRDIKNPFVQVVLNDHFDSLDNIAPLNLSFSIIPLINAVVRVGTMEEKDFLFRALNGIGSDETFVVTKKKKNKATGKFDKYEVHQSFYEYVYDICKKVKNRQATLTKKIMAKLDEDIDNSGGISIGILETSENGSVTGLVANKVSKKYQKPALLLHYVIEDGKAKYIGSGRGNTKVLPSLKDWCNDTGLVEFAQGHANAFGICIPEENFEKFKEKTKEIEQEDFVYEVDLHLHGETDKDAIYKVEDNKYLIGGKFHEPLFAFTGIKIKKQFIRQRGSMLTFFDRGIEFVMFGAPHGLFESITNNFDEYITMDFVGRPGTNSWGGKVTPRLVLVDCERNEESPNLEAPKNINTPEITAENIVF